MTVSLDKFADQLDWNLLRTFMVIVQQRSLTAAAARLSVTQPSVSLALKRLEDRLERRLLDRGGATSFRVTEAGEVLYRHCVEIHATVASLPNAVDATRQTVQGVVTIHLSGHVHWPDLTRVIADFRREFPLVRFRLRRATCEEILAALSQKTITLGVVSRADHRPFIVPQKLFDQPMGLYRAAGPAVDPSALPFVTYEGDGPGSPFEVLTAWRFKVGCDGAVVADGADVDGVADLILAGVGLGVLPRAYGERHPGLAALPFDPPPPSIQVHLVRNDQMLLSPAEQRFIHHLTLTGLCPPSWSRDPDGHQRVF